MTTIDQEGVIRWDLNYFEGPRVAIVRMDSVEQRYSLNATPWTYCVTPPPRRIKSR